MGAIENPRQSNSLSTIAAAAFGGCSKYIDHLLALDPLVLAQDDIATSSVYAATGGGHESIFIILIKRLTIARLTRILDHQKLLSLAIFSMCPSILAFLLSEVFEFLTKTQSPRNHLRLGPSTFTPLETVLWLGSDELESVRYPWRLAQSKEENTSSLTTRRLAFAEMLLKNGVDVEATSSPLQTPFHVAARVGGVDYLRLLVSHGANVMARDSNSWTALHHAAARLHLQQVQFLVLEAGIDVECAACGGLTALHIAIQENPNLGIRFDDPPPEGKRDTQRDPDLSCLEMVKLLLGLGTSVCSTTGDKDRSPLHIALETGGAQSWPRSYGLFSLVSELLAKGANAMARDRLGLTPLHLLFAPRKPAQTTKDLKPEIRPGPAHA